MKAAQVGFTEAGNNWIAYIITQAPGPSMIVLPTEKLCSRASKFRIKPLLNDTPEVRERIHSGDGRAAKAELEKEFPGGFLILATAGAASDLRMLPIRYLFLDERDAYTRDSGGEGDPVDLAEKRTSTFAKSKIFQPSTPLLDGSSPTADEFEQTDQRYFHVPCPKCEHSQTLVFERLRWPGPDKDEDWGQSTHKDARPHDAKYQCESCGFLIANYQKTKMLRAGKWIAKFPGRGGETVAGFHLNALFSPVGWFDWGKAAKQYVDAVVSKNPKKMQTFCNLVKGLPYKMDAEVPEWERLYKQREDYPLNILPRPGVFLTAGVDVQADRLEVEVVAWGRNMESWSIDYRVFPGKTNDIEDQCWKSLEDMLKESWPINGCDSRAPIAAMAIDTGYRAKIVYNWVRSIKQTLRVFAVKGMDQLFQPFGRPKPIDIKVDGKTFRRALKLWPVGVSHLKAELYGFLDLEPPEDGANPPYGFCHYPDYDEDFFLQLTAEEIVTEKLPTGHTKQVFKKVRDRNEVLDCRTYARAAASLKLIDRFTDKDWDALEQNPSLKPAEKYRSRRKKKKGFLNN